MAGSPQAPYTTQLDEACPDCGRKPISGQFVVLGRFSDPAAMRKKLLATGTLDVRVVGVELHTLLDWTCSDPVCKKQKTYTMSPAERLAKRVQQ